MHTDEDFVRVRVIVCGHRADIAAMLENEVEPGQRMPDGAGMMTTLLWTNARVSPIAT
jgi:hypothetical protein